MKEDDGKLIAAVICFIVAVFFLAKAIIEAIAYPATFFKVLIFYWLSEIASDAMHACLKSRFNKNEDSELTDTEESIALDASEVNGRFAVSVDDISEELSIYFKDKDEVKEVSTIDISNIYPKDEYGDFIITDDVLVAVHSKTKTITIAYNDEDGSAKNKQLLLADLLKEKQKRTRKKKEETIDEQKTTN